MKRILLAFLFVVALAIPVHAFTAAERLIMAGGGGAAATVLSGCSGSPTYTGSSGCLARETFQGSTLCYSGLGNYCDHGLLYAYNVNFDYTGNSGCTSSVTPYACCTGSGTGTCMAPLAGVRSLYSASGSTNSTAQLTVASSSTVYAGAVVSEDARIDNSGFLSVGGCQLVFYNNNTMSVFNTGGTMRSTSVTVTPNTKYYVMLEAVAGSPTGASCTPYYSSNGSSWTTGTASTDGTWTAAMTFIQVGNPVASGGNMLINDVRASTSSFNYW